jgi:hypothetical protein
MDGSQSPAEDGRADLTRLVRAAFVGVAVVDVSDLASECGALDYGAGRLDLG